MTFVVRFIDLADLRHARFRCLQVVNILNTMSAIWSINRGINYHVKACFLFLLGHSVSDVLLLHLWCRKVAESFPTLLHRLWALGLVKVASVALPHRRILRVLCFQSFAKRWSSFSCFDNELHLFSVVHTLILIRDATRWIVALIKLLLELVNLLKLTTWRSVATQVLATIRWPILPPLQ